LEITNKVSQTRKKLQILVWKSMIFLILECAKSIGFSPPKKVKLQEWNQSDPNLFPVAKWVWYELNFF